MILSLAVNANGDLYVGADGSLATTHDLAAVMQACEHEAKTLLGEMVFATDRGVPYFDVAWNGVPSLPQFEAYLRRAWAIVGGVVRVLTLTTSRRGNDLLYTAQIETVYGTGTVTNG